ncbi:MAG: amidohydrolase, partial [Pseudomonadota bacterium]|nr:amidohydrolase [Pseudomonadota bacterium]
TRSQTETTPPTINDEQTSRRIKSAFVEHFGDKTIVEQPRDGMGAEDFAYFVEPELGVKGVYFAVGGTPKEEVEEAPAHHSPLFKIEPEPAITVGVEAMTIAALELFEVPNSSAE